MPDTVNFNTILILEDRLVVKDGRGRPSTEGPRPQFGDLTGRMVLSQLFFTGRSLISHCKNCAVCNFAVQRYDFTKRF